MRTLHDILLDELADRYDSEKRLVIALPKVIEAATCAQLRAALETHLMETERQVLTIGKVFKLFGVKPRLNKCSAILGLLAEGAEIMADNKGLPVINAALVAVVQKIVHYEIASYGCLREWAGLLRNKPAAQLLQAILNEKKASNRALHKLARAYCNDEALHPDRAIAVGEAPRKQKQSLRA